MFLVITTREKIYVPSPSAAGRKEGPDFGNSERQVRCGAGSGKLGKEKKKEKKGRGEKELKSKLRMKREGKESREKKYNLKLHYICKR
jgi:hypothetical protein